MDTKYICRYCNRVYSTEKEWSECEKACENALEEMFKVGVQDWDD